MTIEVTRTNSGWDCTKDGKTISIKDNGDGILSNGDALSGALSGSGFTQQDIQAVANKWNNQESGYKPKKNFGQKVGSFFKGTGNFLMGTFTGFANSFMLASGGNDIWSRNYRGGVGFNDMQVGMYGAKPGLFNFNMNNLYSSMNLGTDSLGMGGLGGGYNFGAIFDMAAQAAERQKQQYQQMYDEMAAKERKENLEKNYDNVNKNYESYKEHPETIDSANFKKYEDGLNRAKENNKEFKPEDVTLMNKIYNAPLIPEQLVQDKEDDKTKMTFEQAAKLNDLLTKYNKADDKKKEEVLKIDDYNNLSAILKKSTLEEADFKILDALLK